MNKQAPWCGRNQCSLLWHLLLKILTEDDENWRNFKTNVFQDVYADQWTALIYVAAKATYYIRLLHGKIGFLGCFSAQLRKKGSDPYSAWMKYVVCLHLYIPWKFGERGSTPRGARAPSLSVFCLFVRHATMLGTESLDGAYTHWTWGERA